MSLTERHEEAAKTVVGPLSVCRSFCGLDLVRTVGILLGRKCLGQSFSGAWWGVGINERGNAPVKVVCAG